METTIPKKLIPSHNFRRPSRCNKSQKSQIINEKSVKPCLKFRHTNFFLNPLQFYSNKSTWHTRVPNRVRFQGKFKRSFSFKSFILENHTSIA